MPLKCDQHDSHTYTYFIWFITNIVSTIQSNSETNGKRDTETNSFELHRHIPEIRFQFQICLWTIWTDQLLFEMCTLLQWQNHFCTLNHFTDCSRNVLWCTLWYSSMDSIWFDCLLHVIFETCFLSINFDDFIVIALSNRIILRNVVFFFLFNEKLGVSHSKN